MNILDDLAVKYGADKSSKFHNYTRYYEAYLNANRQIFKNILEIGVGRGCSLKMWKDYFPNATVFGIDILPSCKTIECDRIKIFIGSQVDDAFLDKTTDGISFDLIVDDGSHRVEHQIYTFKKLFSKVKSKGYYILEDLNTSYWPKFGGGLKKSGATIEFLKDRIDDVYFSGYRYGNSNILNSDLLVQNKPGLNEFEKNIESMHFYNGFVVFLKR